ncbi:MAG: LamG domain-containing protein [Gammaproteobacteria bacterium TMED182]|nr:hypothetical protein [Gammaproteobacteria bacterium]RPG57347.1 MAG: LamG domain-containing protein [Gammaproteobacteria bacterium TMED182]
MQKILSSLAIVVLVLFVMPVVNGCVNKKHSGQLPVTNPVKDGGVKSQGSDKKNRIPVEPAFLKGGLVAYYSFNGNAKDESGYGNDGEAANVEFVSNGFGADGKAGKFKKGSFIKANAKLLPCNNFPRSFSCFVKVTGAQKRTESHIAGWGDKNRNRAFGLFGGNFDSAPNTKGFLAWSQWGDSVFFTKDNKNEIEKNIWYHIVATFDGTSLTTFLNGQKANQRGFKLSTGRGDLFIGQRDSFRIMEGYIDELRIYNHALTEDQVKALHEWESLNISAQTGYASSKKPADLFDLRGKRKTLSVGDVIDVNQTQESESETVLKGRGVKSKNVTKGIETSKVEIMEVANGMVKRVRIFDFKGKEDESGHDFSGKKTKESLKSPFEGKDYTLDISERKIQFPSGFSNEEKIVTAVNAKFITDADFYPDKPVAIGHEWKLTEKQIANSYGNAEEVPNGGTVIGTVKFEGVRNHDNQFCAILTLNSCITKYNPQESFTLWNRSTILRSLDSYRNIMESRDHTFHLKTLKYDMFFKGKDIIEHKLVRRSKESEAD